MLADFTFGSLTDFSYHLIQRCARHAVESRAKDVTTKMHTCLNQVTILMIHGQ